MRRPSYNLLLQFIALTLLAACSTITNPATIPPEATPQEVVTLSPVSDPIEEISTPQAGFTLIPPTFNPAIAPTRTPCSNDAVFVTDLTVRDFSQFLPGAALDKQWLIRNTGTCTWNSDYRVVFAEGSSMSATLEHALYPARPEADAIVRITMLAPDVPGDYQGDWQLRDDEDATFGPILFIKINVIPLPEGDSGG